MLNELTLTKPQSDFALCNATYPLFCGGFGSGKSLTMGARILMDLSLGPKIKIGAYAPTYDLLSLITIPYLEDLFQQAGVRYRLNKQEKKFYLTMGRQVICRSMDNPTRIVGYETLRGHADELDTLREEQAKEAWNKIIARNRQKVYAPDYIVDLFPQECYFEEETGRYVIRNKVSGYTTPEGFVFCYKRWVKNGSEKYERIKVGTRSNPHLPVDYIENLMDSYPAEYVDAYLEGEFVNMRSGRVYRGYDKELNGSTEVVEGDEPIYVGMDFNIQHGAASINVPRGDTDHAVDEIVNSYDTDDTIRVLNERYPSNFITVFPDASGTKRSSGASNGVNTHGKATATDIAKLKAAGFKIVTNRSNPLIKDRVMSVNGRILNAKGERRYFVNAKTCPNHVETLEQQIYDDNGMPDKSTGLDHLGDALGYFLVKKHPLKSNKGGFG